MKTEKNPSPKPSLLSCYFLILWTESSLFSCIFNYI